MVSESELIRWISDHPTQHLMMIDDGGGGGAGGDSCFMQGRSLICDPRPSLANQSWVHARIRKSGNQNNKNRKTQLRSKLVWFIDSALSASTPRPQATTSNCTGRGDKVEGIEAVALYANRQLEEWMEQWQFEAPVQGAAEKIQQPTVQTHSAEPNGCSVPGYVRPRTIGPRYEQIET